MAEDLVGGIADAPSPATEGGIADAAPTTDVQGTAPGIADVVDGEPAGKDQGAGTPASKPAPESYELTAPEDFPLPAENLSSFTAKARELGLTKEQAEGMLQWHRGFHTDVTKRMQQEESSVLSAWGKELGADKEFGGAAYKTTLADARRALDAFDTDGSLRELLRNTQYQYNPAIIRAVARVGRAMGEHGFVGQNGAGKGADIPLEERMYPNMKI